MKRSISFGILLICAISTYAQAQLSIHTSIPVVEKGKALSMPWAGGFSNPVFSQSDINNDGIEDLYIYDVNGQKSLVFLHDGVNGADGYHYAPKYDSIFPTEMHGWVLMRDFDKDGAGELVYYSPPFTKMNKGYRDSNGELRYHKERRQLSFWNSTWQGIAGSAVYLPAIDDVNEDGDLDLLHWDQNGSFLWHYENVSVERGYPLDSMKFDDLTHCFGRIQDDKLNPRVNLNVVCKNKRGAGPRHLGWTTMSFDADGDLDKEVIIGDSGFDNLIYLENGGDTGFAKMTYQDSLWPLMDKKVEMTLWPAAYHIDIDHDNLNDILVSPFHVSDPIDGSIDTNNVWYYKNTGSKMAHNYEFQNDELFTSDMVDVGTGAYPAIVDVNADGLLDVVIGNVGYFKDSTFLEAQLALMLNVGSATSPSFDLVDRNWLDLPTVDSIPLQNAAPAFGDIDQDGDMDMVLGGALGTLWYFENTAGQGNPISFTTPIKEYMNIDVGLYSVPQIIDLNGDSLEDIVIGEDRGHIRYYENIGSKGNPNFTLTEDTLGDLHVRQEHPNPYPSGYAAPYFCELDTSGKLFLLVGCQQGRVHLFDSIKGNLNGAFRRLDTTYQNIDEGSWSNPAVADLDGDGIAEVLVGNRRGGITILGKAMINSWFTTKAVCPFDTVKIYDQSSYADSVRYYYYDDGMNLIDSSGDVDHYIFPDSTDYYIEQIAYSNSGNDTSIRKISFQSSVPSGTISHTIIDTGVAKFDLSSQHTTEYYYDFDDGSGDTTTVDTMVHTYAANGTYQVRVVLVGACSNDTLYQEVVINYIGIDEKASDQLLKARIVPNPGDGNSSLLIKGACSLCKTRISISDVQGKLLSSEIVILGQEETSYRLPEIKSNGVYLVQITNSESTRTLRYIVH